MEDMKKDIYYDGRIYQGVEPDSETDIAFETIRKDCECDDCCYGRDLIGKLTSCPVTGSHSFKDGQDVTGLYSIRPRLDTENFNSTMVATLTPSPVQEEVGKDFKKEALELIQKFRLFTGSYLNDDGGSINQYCVSKHNAKQCAIIHIEGLKTENLSLLEMANLHMDNRASMVLNHRLSHLNHLRQKIESM